MHKSNTLYVALAAVSLTTGCGAVTTESSLINQGVAVKDEAYVGTWFVPPDPLFPAEDKEQEGSIEITLLDDGSYSVRLMDEYGHEEGNAVGRCIEIQGKRFFEFATLASNEKGALFQLPADEAESFSFLSIERENDLLLVRSADSDAFAKLLKRSKQLEGSTSGWLLKKVSISSKPESLALLLAKHHDILFLEPTKFQLRSKGVTTKAP